MIPVGPYAMAAACELMREGDTVLASIDHYRSGQSHNHQFAWVDDAWHNLPEHLAGMPWAINPDTLRKHALIATGWATVEEVVCANKAEALRMGRALKRIGDAEAGYSVTDIRGPVAVLYKPRSQSYRAMGKADFQRSKDAVLNWIAEQIGVRPDQLTGESA